MRSASGVARGLGGREANKVDLGEPPHLIAKLADRDVWLATFREPAGTLHHLMSEVPRAAQAVAFTIAVSVPSTLKAWSRP